MNSIKKTATINIAVTAVTMLVAVVSAVLSSPAHADKMGICSHSAKCRESSINCSKMDNQLLCVYKSVQNVPKPGVFVNGVLTDGSQVKEASMGGAHRHVTGYDCYNQNRTMAYVLYRLGALVITPEQLPAIVEVSFTKDHSSTDIFIQECGYDALPTLSYTFEKSCSTVQLQRQAQCNNFPSSAVSINLVKTASLLANITRHLAETASC